MLNPDRFILVVCGCFTEILLSQILKLLKWKKCLNKDGPAFLFVIKNAEQSAAPRTCVLDFFSFFHYQFFCFAYAVEILSP